MSSGGGRRTHGPSVWALALEGAFAVLAAEQSPAASPPPEGIGWISTWSTAEQLTPEVTPPWVRPPPKADAHSPILPLPEKLADQTVRMVARTTIGGDQVRVQLSNAQGYAPITIGSAHMALHDHGSSIVADTDRVVTFGGRSTIQIPPGAIVVSDPISLKIASMTTLAISLYVPGQVTQLTTHQLGLHTSYVVTGDATAAPALHNASENSSYFWLTGIEVIAPLRSQLILAFGDSITDGYATAPNADRAWPSQLYERIRATPGGNLWAVANLGISGNRVLHDGIAASALARFDRDVLSRPGARWIVFLEGINDISFPAMPEAPQEDHISAEDLIAGYREFIDKAHIHGIKIMGGTLLPWEGVWTFTANGEAIRQRVNQWIRTSGAFDCIVDFDAVTRDPARPTRLRPEFDSGDHVHPNDAGNRAMADAIDLSVFKK